MKIKPPRQTALTHLNLNAIPPECKALKIAGTPQNHPDRRSQRGDFHTSKRNDEPRTDHRKSRRDDQQNHRQRTKKQRHQPQIQRAGVAPEVRESGVVVLRNRLENGLFAHRRQSFFSNARTVAYRMGQSQPECPMKTAGFHSCGAGFAALKAGVASGQYPASGRSSQAADFSHVGPCPATAP